MTWSHSLLILVFASLIVAFAGCAATNPNLPIADLREIPQDCRAALRHDFKNRPLFDDDRQADLAAEYHQKVLSPWNFDYAITPAAKVRDLFRHWQASPGLGENLLPNDPAWIAGLLKDANLAAYPNCRWRAITVRNTSFRQLPTVEPTFLPPAEGLGYPFDRLQESAVWANTPIVVCHVANGGAWVWAESCYSAGWVPANDVAFVDRETVEIWATYPSVAIVRDGVSLRGPGGAFLASVGVGAVLPYDGPHREDSDSNSGRAIYVRAAARMPDGTARMVAAKLSTADAGLWPLEATTGTLAELAGQMIGQSYGWGGLYDLRDCSAMTRDLLAPIGVYLPRNSSEQAKAGKVVPLEGLGPVEKEQRILRDGARMLTLLAAPGHIMLYLGQRDGKALILHNTWGVKVREPDGSESVKKIGKGCITTLQPGRELPNRVLPDADYRRTISAMILLVPNPSGQNAKGGQ